MISTIDFLHELFLAQPLQLSKSQQFYHERAIKIQLMQQQADEIITSYLATANLPKNLLQLIDQTYSSFHQNIAGQNHELALYDVYFFKAFNDVCTTAVTNGFQITPTFKRLIELTRDARGVFKYIQLEHLRISDDFTSQLKQVEKAVERLKNLSTNLLQEF